MASSRPMSASCLTARGVSPSPHVLSRGNVFFSTTSTSWPASASQYAVAAPAGPPPTTRTSTRRSGMRTIVPGRSPLHLLRGRGGGVRLVRVGVVVRAVGLGGTLGVAAARGAAAVVGGAALVRRATLGLGVVRRVVPAGGALGVTRRAGAPAAGLAAAGPARGALGDLVALGRRVVEHLALVPDDGEDLVGAQHARVAERRHGAPVVLADVLTAGPVRVAVGRALGRRAVRHPVDVVLDVREREEGLAREGTAGAAFAAGAVAAGALRREDLLALQQHRVGD